MAGLLENRLEKAREDLEEALEAVRALCEPVEAPRDSAAYLHYFCAKDSGDAAQLKDNEPKRLKLYKFVASLIRAFASIAGEMEEAGYKANEIEANQGGGRSLRQGARRNQAGERRLHRPQGV